MSRIKLEVMVPEELDYQTRLLVKATAEKMAKRLYQKQQEGKGGWHYTNWMPECRTALLRHILKGDPINVINYAAFLAWHGKKTNGPTA